MAIIEHETEDDGLPTDDGRQLGLRRRIVRSPASAWYTVVGNAVAPSLYLFPFSWFSHLPVSLGHMMESVITEARWIPYTPNEYMWIDLIEIYDIKAKILYTVCRTKKTLNFYY